MPNIIYGLLILAAMVAVFIFVFLLNKNTPLPEGCEHLVAECNSCSQHSCTHHPISEEGNDGQ